MIFRHINDNVRSVVLGPDILFSGNDMTVVN